MKIAPTVKPSSLHCFMVFNLSWGLGAPGSNIRARCSSVVEKEKESTTPVSVLPWNWSGITAFSPIFFKISRSRIIKGERVSRCSGKRNLKMMINSSRVSLRSSSTGRYGSVAEPKAMNPYSLFLALFLSCLTSVSGAFILAARPGTWCSPYLLPLV